MEIAMQANEDLLRKIIGALPTAIIIVNYQGQITLVNKQAEKLFGYGRDELIAQSVEILLPESLRAQHVNDRKGYTAQPDARAMGLGQDLLARRKDGTTFPVEIGLNPVVTSQGPMTLSAIVDISVRKAMEATLFAEKERILVTLESIGDAVISTDATGHVDYLNPIAEMLTGWSLAQAQECYLEKVFRILDERTRKLLPNPVARCLAKGSTIKWNDHTVLVSRDGHEYAIEDSVAPIRNRNGRLLGAVLVFRDVSEKRRLVKEIAHQAAHDPLTGLVNRREFEYRLKNLLENVHNQSGEHALCYLDLDRFKVVNDTCGHAAGDELLRQVTQLFRSRIRSRDTLGRLGGDEFGVLLENCSVASAQHIAQALRQLIDDYRFVWDGKTFRIGVSIGLAPISKATKDITTVLTAADSACFVAKETGRNRVHVYQAQDEQVTRQLSESHWVHRIQQALDENRFQLYGQRIAAFESSTATGIYCELLLRLIEADGQVVLPGVFISAAERYQLAVQIDCWVVTHALHLLSQQPTFVDRLAVCAINLSGQSVGNQVFYHHVLKEFDKTGVPPAKICFEITETAAVINLSGATCFIEDLKNLGCRFALDDFGNGLSSLSYLKNLAVDFLKIDGVFVRDTVDDPIDLAMVKSINEIGQLMGKQTIAEHVENEAILKQLEGLGIDYVQGYGISRPCPIEDLIAVSHRECKTA
jgi:diguanylate cyclase (GGDEF)-like protein/PAS domain S-box-containing protein